MRRAFLNIVNWVKSSFEGNDGKASYRRLTALAFGILNAYLILADKLQIEHRVNVYYANLIAILLIIGIVTAQNILDLLNRGKNENQSSPTDNQESHGSE